MDDPKVVTPQLEQDLHECHRKLKGALLQLETTMTALDIAYRPMLDISHKRSNTVPVL